MTATIQLDFILEELRVLNVVLVRFLKHDDVVEEVFSGVQNDIALIKGIAARVNAQYMVRKLELGTSEA